MRNWSGTARRLLLGFGSLFLVFSAASFATLQGFAGIHAGLRRSVDRGESVRLALELASAVRDQYAHQGHPPKLRQVLFNLVRNAAEAAGAGGRVEIRLAQSGDVAEASVSDSGPGIAPEARSRLFEPFFTTKDRGTGLGLAVSQAIARAHRGSIHVDEAAAGGARFTLRLPASSEGGQP